MSSHAAMSSADQQQTYGGSASSYGRAGTLKKSVNRFSVFVKAGAEAFLIGATKDKTIDANNMLHINVSPPPMCLCMSVFVWG